MTFLICRLVEFTHKADMMKALERMNGKELNGRKIELTEDKTTQKRRRRCVRDFYDVCGYVVQPK